MANKNSRDTLSGLTIGTLFIVAGILIFADKQGVLAAGWFWWLMFAAGLVLLLEGVIRTWVKEYQRSSTSRMIWGAVLVALSSSQIYDLEDWWPLIFILVGALMITNALRRPKPSSKETSSQPLVKD